MPVEATPAVSDDGDVVYRSFENLRLEKNIALPRVVVVALDRDRIYTLYGIFGHHDGHGAPVDFVDNNPAPQPLWVKYDKLTESFSGAQVKADALYGIDNDRWERTRGYAAVIR